MACSSEESCGGQAAPGKEAKTKRLKKKEKYTELQTYNPSDYCFDCVTSAGRKCENCELFKPILSVSSLISFQEGPKKKRIKPSYICSIHCKYDIVRHVASKLGMKESIDNWNVLWSDFTVNCERVKNLRRYQKVNHFPGMIEICRKDLLARNLNRMFKIFPEDYDFYPKTWLLPTDYTEVLEFARCNKNKTYILKPDLGCKGKGISLTRNVKQMSGMDRTICQIYVAKPYLIDGFKFDLRVYALLTSCDPLRLYVYNEGLARFATRYYEEPSKSNLSNMYMHLTNYSVNKFSRNYKLDPDEGSKRKLSTLNDILRSEYHDVHKIWKEIDDVIIKTVFLALPTLQHSYRAAIPKPSNLKSCFEILGFDLILDENLKPYLLEVNHSPSFHTDAPIDREVKESLLVDTFRLLDLPKNNKSKVLQEERKHTTNRLLKDLGADTSWNRELENQSAEELIIKSDIFEMENIGNYRRIYPSENTDKYDRYYSQGQSSLFHETFASRAREKATKIEMENKQNEKRFSPELLQASARYKGLPSKEKSSLEWVINSIKCDQPPRSLLLNQAVSMSPIVPQPEEIKFPEVKSQLAIPPSLFTHSPLEERRISRFNEKQELLESVNVLEKIHNTMKTFGEMRLKKDIKKARRNKWTMSQFDNEKRISLQNSLSDVIQHIGKCVLPFDSNNYWQINAEGGLGK